MTAVIEFISSEKDWENKIFVEKVIQTWKDELTQKSFSTSLVNQAINILKRLVTKRSSNTGHWFMIPIKNDEIWPVQCGCSCLICQGLEHTVNNFEVIEDDEENRQKLNQLKKLKKIICICTDFCSRHATEFLKKSSAFQTKLISPALRDRFLHYLAIFQASKYPNLVSPPFYESIESSSLSAIDAVTLVRLPSEFMVIRDSETNMPIQTIISSPINSADPNDPLFNGLYEFISEIFTLFVPNFEKILGQINAEKLNNQAPPSAKLEHCQVMVKLDRYRLTPENSILPEENWQFDGVAEENILATGVYYFHVENIQKTSMKFRAPIQFTNYHGSYHFHNFLKLHCHQNSMIKSNIILGRIPIKENLCLFYPNYLQHRHSTISLQEGCDEGFYGSLAFHLVNPARKIKSTDDSSIMEQLRLVPIEETKSSLELFDFERKFEIARRNAFIEGTTE